MVLRRFWRNFCLLQRGRYFMRRIDYQMVFYIGPWFRFLHISRKIMVVRRFWRIFYLLQRGRYFMRRINSQMVWYFVPWFRSLHISREIMVLRLFRLNFRVTKGGGIYKKHQLSTGFWFRAIISFSAYISWKNGFTAILTKFLPSTKGEFFMRSINCQMVFDFEA